MSIKPYKGGSPNWEMPGGRGAESGAADAERTQSEGLSNAGGSGKETETLSPMNTIRVRTRHQIHKKVHEPFAVRSSLAKANRRREIRRICTRSEGSSPKAETPSEGANYGINRKQPKSDSSRSLGIKDSHDMADRIEAMSQEIRRVVSSEAQSKFDAFPERTKLAITLFYSFIPNYDHVRDLPDLINSIEQEPLHITTPCRRMAKICKTFGVLELQRPTSDTLLFGCGSKPLHGRCKKDHRNFDTLDISLLIRPKIVTDCDNVHLIEYFESISHKYQRIIDEIPSAFSLLTLPMIQGILKTNGTLTLPAHLVYGFNNDLQIYRGRTGILLETVEDSFQPPCDTYNFDEPVSLQIINPNI